MSFNINESYIENPCISCDGCPSGCELKFAWDKLKSSENKDTK